MCGIFGITEKNKEITERMLDKIAYRGPDARGIYEDDFVTLGHNRLSIIDLDERSTQPMWSSDGKIGIVFNGEIYNFVELKNSLSQKYNFRTSSDTEVLLYAYKEYGVEMMQKIEGMYAFAIYDKEKEKLLLTRDSSGIKPLCYALIGNKLVFGSEIKTVIGVLRDKELEVTFDDQALKIYYSIGYIPSPMTLYTQVRRLEVDSYIEYDLKKSEFCLKKKPLGIDKEMAGCDEKILSNTIEKKVLAHLIADVPVGVFFSGGTDSTLLASILAKNNINLKTYSIRMGHKREDEEFFTKIIDRLKLQNKIDDFSVEQFDGIYSELISKLDDPTYDASIFPTYFVSKMAARDSKVVWSGEGGDEYFGGYARQKHIQKMGSVNSEKINLLDIIYHKLPHFSNKNRIFKILFYIFKMPVSLYLIDVGSGKDLVDHLEIKNFVAKSEIKPNEIDQKLYLENDLLRKTDYATSYNSIEGRVPLLDVDIINQSKYFSDKAFTQLGAKSVLKKVLCNFIEPEFVYRGKSGFNLSLRQIFKESKYLKTDLVEAINFLKLRKINFFKEINVDNLSDNPFFCFSLIILYYVIKNNEIN